MRMLAFGSSLTFVAKDCKVSYNIYIFYGWLFGKRVTMRFNPKDIRKRRLICRQALL